MASVGFGWLVLAFGFCWLWLFVALVGLGFFTVARNWKCCDIPKIYQDMIVIKYFLFYPGHYTYRLKNPRVGNDRACISCGFGQPG